MDILNMINDTKEKEEKKEIYTIPLEQSIKSKLYEIANKGYGVAKPTLITKKSIQDAIDVYVEENQIYTEVNMSNCKELALSFKRILKIANLDNLVMLETLRLDNNIIMKIENLDKLKNLKWLDLSFNNITQIEGLESLINLTDLSLFNNEIKDIYNLDLNARLNILSIGNNKITDVKKMCDYLKKFQYLQGLTVSGNPFIKEIDTGNYNNNQNPSFPLSYEPIIISLDKLKYLDYRPVDPDERDKLINNSHKNDLIKEREQAKADESKDKSFAKFVVELTKANSQYIINFWHILKEKLINEKIYENFRKIIGMEDKLILLENHVFDTLFTYKNEILEKQVVKEQKENHYLREIDANIEEIVQKSKDEIQGFKKRFREYMKNLPENWSMDVIEKNIRLDLLKEKLFEMEVFTKKIVTDMIAEMEGVIEGIVSEMNQKTSSMHNNLENYKHTLKSNLQQNYEEHTKNLLNNDDEQNVDEDDIPGDIEKVIESYSEDYDKLKEMIERERNDMKTQYFTDLRLKEYYRDRKRIEDINEVYSFWQDQVQQTLKKLNDDKTKGNKGKYY